MSPRVSPRRPEITLLIGLDFRGLHAVQFVNRGWYDNVPLHAPFDQTRVAHDRG